MLIKFFQSGMGGGLGPVGYLVAGKVKLYDENRDLVRNDQGGVVMVERNPKPTVLRGDPSNTSILIDACRHKWSYRSGVMSFTRDDAPSEEAQNAAMDAFEDLAFAGLDRGQYDCLWVRHEHEGRVELHFCTPRLELLSGKSLNIAPPGYQHDFDALRDHLNKINDWADPEDPERAAEAKPIVEATSRAQTREELHDWITDQIADGQISDRSTLIAILCAHGYEVPRAGEKYVTALDPETGERMRLKGTFFHENWTIEKQIDREVAAEGGAGRGSGKRLARCNADDLHRRYRKACEKRAKYNRERYRSVRGIDGPESNRSRQAECDLGEQGSGGERDRPRGEDELAKRERDADRAADDRGRDRSDGGQSIGNSDHLGVGDEGSRRPFTKFQADFQFPWRSAHEPRPQSFRQADGWIHRSQTDDTLQRLAGGDWINADATRERIADLRRRANGCLRSFGGTIESIRSRADVIGRQIDETEQAYVTGFDLYCDCIGRLSRGFSNLVASLERWSRSQPKYKADLGGEPQRASGSEGTPEQSVQVDDQRSVTPNSERRTNMPSP